MYEGMPLKVYIFVLFAEMDPSVFQIGTWLET